MGEATFEPLRGDARVVVQTRSTEDDLDSAIGGVPDFLSQIEPTIRTADGTVTVAVALVGGAADEALNQQAIDLATSVRAGS